MNETKEKIIEDLERYENKWVAIYETETERRIVGSGNDAVEAVRDAERNGYTEVVLLGVPRFDAVFIPAA